MSEERGEENDVGDRPIVGRMLGSSGERISTQFEILFGVKPREDYEPNQMSWVAKDRDNSREFDQIA